jgi:hypothetical protein
MDSFLLSEDRSEMGASSMRTVDEAARKRTPWSFRTAHGAALRIHHLLSVFFGEGAALRQRQ